MNNLIVIKIESESITFDNGYSLFSNHDQNCCEHHYLKFDDLTLNDFDGLVFDLTNDDFFKRIEGYGIELMPIQGHSVIIPGYASNNGWYSSDLELVVCDEKGKTVKQYDITECQEWEY